MFKKIIKPTLVLVLLLSALALIAYLNSHHLLRIQNNLPPFSHQAGDKFIKQIKMRDGVNLYTRIYLPKESKAEEQGAWPVVLMRNPYEILDRYLIAQCQVFIRYGYACALQHARGQGDSEGVWEPLVNEPNDGSDTLHWLAKQSWVDGNIGMWGVSYLALVQWTAAIDPPPELKTIVPISMGTDFHRTLFENGAFRHFVTWWMMVMPSSKPDMSNGDEDNFLKAARHMPHTEVDEKFTEFKLAWYKDWISSAEKTAPIWTREDAQQLAQVAKNMKIPVLMFDGWYDPFFGALFQDYLELGTREDSVLVIGPWNHMQQVAGDFVDEDVESASELSMQLVLMWFDRYLKNNQSSEQEAGYIKVYDVGANAWAQYKSWPPKHETLVFNLSDFENANACEGGVLSQEENTQQEKIGYLFNPENPVMSKGGSGFIVPLSDDLGPGAVEQENICERDDVLTFISKPLKNDTSIVGEVRVNLLVSSDAEDTMFTAKLIDVSPKGEAVNVRDSATTLALRNGVRNALIYEPNSIVEVAIDMWAIQWTLKAGHRLRLDISSSNFPVFNIHSNYAGAWEKQNQRQSAQQTIYAPANVELPILINE